LVASVQVEVEAFSAAVLPSVEAVVVVVVEVEEDLLGGQVESGECVNKVAR
jgi:hypothetical protein